ncbi:hypothetical protein C8A01DRAFT_34029 [Parachaetomium inaequale]|uniref:Uncharacterized protein n=1 Tax=Parachaetomium inaequale TaxID=2588326 RepID=A0AAN6PJQ0_9PEZI|nr:hypothetical protein C8A01DRAFT_34029 [Parachaetomium inaequale]
MTCQPLPDACGRPSDRGSSHHHTEHAACDCEALPSYESLEDLSPPPKPADDPNGREAASAQQVHSCTFTEYSNQNDQAIELAMAPNPDGFLDHPAPQWAAVLMVKTSDVPRLMREGFFWSAENVLPEEGYLSSETRREWRDVGFRLTRTWILVDKSNHEDGAPGWVAHLEVMSSFREVLAGFRVQSLSRENVYAARAWNRLRQEIYGYDCRWPGRYNYNCIYDDKPLRGWWPWPREEGDYVGFSALAMELDVVGALPVVEDLPSSGCVIF